MPYSYLSHLRCSKTGEIVDADQPQQLSPVGAPLLASYDLEALKQAWHPAALLGRPASLWRYHELLPVRDPDITAKAVAELLSTDLRWYFHLALRTSEHGRVSLRNIRVPAAFVAGRWDLLAGSRDMRTAAERIEGATYVELPGTHFLNLEKPEQVHELLLEFLRRVP